MALIIAVILSFLLFANGDPLSNIPTHQLDFPAHCFDCGPGVSRLDAGIAASAACNYWQGEVMLPSPSPSSGGFGYVYSWSGGNIYLSAIPFWMTMGCGDEVVLNDFFVDEERCYYSFMTPIDSCNTDGENGKQGGFWYDWCANVTINPNPDGCYDSSMDITVTHNHIVDSGGKVAGHFASDEEHELARLAILNRDPSLKSAKSPKAATPNSLIAKSNDAAETDEVLCFNGEGANGICYYTTRTTIWQAANWFCNTHRGLWVSSASNGNPLAYSANYSYDAPPGWISAYPGYGFIDLSVGLHLGASDPTCALHDENWLIDYNVCLAGLLHAIDACDFGDLERKHGGRFFEGCFSYEVAVLPCDGVFT